MLGLKTLSGPRNLDVLPVILRLANVLPFTQTIIFNLVEFPLSVGSLWFPIELDYTLRNLS